MAVNINFHQAFPNLLSYVSRFPVCVWMANILVAFPKAFFSIFRMCVCVCKGVCALPNRKLTKFPTLCKGARYLYSVHSPVLSLSPSLYLSHSLCEFQLSTESRATGRKNENRKQLFMFGGAVKNKMNEHIKKNKNTHTQR